MLEVIDWELHQSYSRRSIMSSSMLLHLPSRWAACSRQALTKSKLMAPALRQQAQRVQRAIRRPSALSALPKLLPFAAGAVYALTAPRASCTPEGVQQLPSHPHPHDLLLHQLQLEAPSLAERIWRWLELLVRCVSLLLNYSPVLLLSPLALITPSGVLERWWWDLLMDRIRAGGPCGVKFAQWLSTRPDLFPLTLCHRLSDLQSYTPSDTSSGVEEEVEHILSAAYGPSYEEVLSVDRGGAGTGGAVVLGEGCVAQVLRGHYKGQAVAIKIVRPSARRTIAADLLILSHLTHLLEALVPGTKAISLADSVQQFSQLMLDQLDMRLEAAHLSRFRRNFSRSADRVCFPEPVLHLAREEVMVEAHCAGPLLRDYAAHCSAEQKKKIAAIGLEAIFQMVFLDNFIHADMHPGNIVCRPLPGGDEVALCFIDAGLTVELGAADQMNLVSLFRAVTVNDGPAVGHLLIDKSRSPEGVVDADGFVQGITKLVDAVHAHGLHLGRIGVSQLLGDVLRLCYTHQVAVCLPTHANNTC